MLGVLGACLLVAVSPDAGRLRVEPDVVGLVGPDASVQLLVEVEQSGQRVDLTSQSTYETSDAHVATVDASGLVAPVRDGKTTIRVRHGSDYVDVGVEVRDADVPPPVDFATEIVPILSKHGCNAGNCHGKSIGQNGFRLSLLGFDPEFDYVALVREGRGRRVFPAAPERSLFLLKPTASIPHGGGRKFGVDSPEYRAISRWISQGTPRAAQRRAALAGIEVSPAARTLEARAGQQLRVVARYADGTTADVTRLARFHSNSPDLAGVDERGRMQAHSAVGQAAIMVRFGGQVAVARATIPRAGAVSVWEPPASDNPVDTHIFARLKELRLRPSPAASDAEFARRSSLDLRGKLPTPEEVARYEADTSPDRRARWIDWLLAQPEYADYFALKWSAILRNQRGQFGDATQATTFAFHAWIRQAMAQNMPYDAFASALIAAKGDPASNPAVAWYRVRNFETQSDESLMEDTAQLFLGMRIQCAKCHHHPFERWSQDDYYGFASFFSRVGRKPSDDPFAPRVYTRASGKARHPNKDVDYEPKALAGPEFAGLGPHEDPRDALAGWLRQSDNPFFAKALVNRYWKHFFGQGLVEPEDDMRVTNPPTHPELLDELAARFVASGFDLKQLVRVLATSEAYALSSLPIDENRDDRQNFARFYPRRLTAEVLLDAIDDVTGAREGFGGLPQGTRAIQLPDEGFGSEFLQVFGQPKRESVCECERTSEPSLAQRLQLLNSDEIEQKLAAGRAQAWSDAAKDNPALDEQHVETLYRLALGRAPDAEERDASLAHLARARAHDRLKQGYEDLVWALINTQEFLFNR